MFKIALVGPELEENLSLRYLASSLMTAGFDCEIVPFNYSRDLPEVLAILLSMRERPGILGLSLSFQLRAKDFIALAVALRQNGYSGHVTAGGHFGTFACKEILRDFPEIDSICRHESENTLVSLAGAIQATSSLKDVPGLIYRDETGGLVLNSLSVPPELDSLPWPDRRSDPAEYLGHLAAPLVGSRGCYAKCTFCCISAWHEKASPGKRFRLRSVESIAAEMAWLFRERKIEIFIFHDDNFFLPDRAQTLQRIDGLANQLEQRGVYRFATIVKARPNDLDEEIVTAMQERLGLLRIYLGIETNSDAGLHILGRRVSRAQNHRALDLLLRKNIYPCFNMLIFDPSTKIEDLETNLDFMNKFAEVPQNFGRVELYAGTPLLSYMQKAGRCQGDYLEWDYRMADEDVQRVFELAMRCFYVRNFSEKSAAHHLMGTRFCTEVAAHFHPDVFRISWMSDAKKLNCILTQDSVKAMREIIEFVKQCQPPENETEFVNLLSSRLRATELMVQKAAGLLETEICDSIAQKAIKMGADIQK